MQKTESGKAVGEVVNLLKFNQHFWMWPIARDIHRIQVDKNNVEKVLSNKFYNPIKYILSYANAYLVISMVC